MTKQNHISRAWDIIEKARIGMLTTQFAGGLRARPLEARADRDAGLIWFVTDIGGAKDDEINADKNIGLIFIDEDTRAYLSITGRASVAHDTAKAKEIWKTTDDIWLQGGPDDPNVRVLRVEPITAELWDRPSRAAGAAFEFAKARLTGEKLNFGENRKVTVPIH